MNRPTSKLRVHSRARQEQAIARADATGAAADWAVSAIWRKLLALLRDHDGNPYTAQRRARALFAPMAGSVAWTLGKGLHSLARWSWKSAGAGIQQALSASYIKTVVGESNERLSEERAKDFSAGHRESSYQRDRSCHRRVEIPLIEDESDPSRFFFDLLFPPPSETDLARMMGDGWLRQLARSTRLAMPETLARIVGAGYAAGKDQREIAKDLLPAVEGVRVSARRVSRTEGLRIAHVAQMAMHESLGPLVTGYTIHATLDARTRKAHRERDGLVWHKDSGVPMTAALRMEAETLPDGYNCRCYLSPILRTA